MTINELLSRARGSTGRRIRYRLGGGSLDPATPSPAGEDGSCDCSAFVCWALGLRKYQPALAWLRRLNGGWYSTDGIWWDATCESTGFFEGAPATLPPGQLRRRVGQVLVYPGATAARAANRAPGRMIGHVGIVSALTTAGRVDRVIHCSAGNWRRRGDAILETSLAEFGTLPETAALAWCASVESTEGR